MDHRRTELIVGNGLLAHDIHKSISSALHCSFFNSSGGNTVRAVFERSLSAAIRDIETHPRGKLFRRLIEYGPHSPDEPKSPNSDGMTYLSDPECELCVEFIYSHMVNRFKGELAELLALAPCTSLFQQQRVMEHLSGRALLFWGDIVRERRASALTKDKDRVTWGSFAKGADGLIVEEIIKRGSRPKRSPRILGVIEIKSMRIGKKKILNQIGGHIARFRGGLKLGNTEWPPDSIIIPSDTNKGLRGPILIRIYVIPSNWKLSREWHKETTDRGWELVFPRPFPPSRKNLIEELESGIWKITLGWSEEALAQAAYEMTFWYMSQVGKYVFQQKPLPTEWEYMTPEQAGYNAIKAMLYYIPLRHISKRHERLATRLYNVYSFGYQAAVDSKEMLWPQDFGGPGASQA